MSFKRQTLNRTNNEDLWSEGTSDFDATLTIILDENCFL
jgi:hypothetical protein